MVGHHAADNQERSQATNVTIRVVPRELVLSSLAWDGSFLFLTPYLAQGLKYTGPVRNRPGTAVTLQVQTEQSACASSAGRIEHRNVAPNTADKEKEDASNAG